MDLEALIPQVKEAVGAIISKPKISDKLLGKPPFRFIHDVISGISNATGFAQGLLPEELLNSANITDKNMKIQY